MAVFLMYGHYKSSVQPLGEAVECACLSIGDTCIEAQNFTYDFWHDYWKHKIPQVFKDVARLRAETIYGGGYLQEESPLIQVNAPLASTGHARLAVASVFLHNSSDYDLKPAITRHHMLQAA